MLRSLARGAGVEALVTEAPVCLSAERTACVLPEGWGSHTLEVIGADWGDAQSRLRRVLFGSPGVTGDSTGSLLTQREAPAKLKSVLLPVEQLPDGVWRRGLGEPKAEKRRGGEDRALRELTVGYCGTGPGGKVRLEGRDWIARGPASKRKITLS